MGGDDEEPSPALRDRAKSFKTSPSRHPSLEGIFRQPAFTCKIQLLRRGKFFAPVPSCVAVWMDCSTQFHFAFGRLEGCCQSDVTPLLDFCFDAKPFQDADHARRIRVFDLKCLKRTPLGRIL